MVKDTKLYDLLEVSPTASSEEINKAYKKLAKKYHPDKNLDDENAQKKLMEINEAKDILTDNEKRHMYDQVGMDYLNHQNQPSGPSPEDLFSMFGGGVPHGFPGGFPGGVPHGFQGGPHQKAEHIVVHETVTLSQIYNEENILINFKQKVYCVKCNGEGTKDGSSSSCGSCKGVGVVLQTIRIGPITQQAQSACGNCRGSGKIQNPNNNCNECNGDGHKLRHVRLPIRLKCGLSDGNQMQVQNQGHQFKNEKTDLLIVIHVEPHAIFKRNGNDLIIDIELKLFQALFGFEKIIEHLDKRKLHISHTGKTENNQSRKINGEGIKSIESGEKGDLIVNFTYKLPDITNVETIQKLQYLLKSINQEESNNEVEIRMSPSSYVKTQLTDMNEPYQNEQQSQQHHHHHSQRVHVEGGGQQCVHQ